MNRTQRIARFNLKVTAADGRVGPAILAVTLAAIKIIESVAVLVEYGRARKGGES
jgi:hypothetical protein